MLLFGGPYSNLQATEAMRAKAEALEIPPERVLCNGDLVAYCAEPNETLALLQQWGAVLMQGNCEQSLAEGAADCGCGFEQGSACSLLSQQWYRYSSERVGSADKVWMGQLPEAIAFELAGKRWLVVHGGLSRNNRFLFVDSPEVDFAEELALTDADIIVAGHCGIPFARQVGERVWLNTGVIGMPANDGQRCGWYLLVEPDAEGGVVCRWQQLAYDASTAAARMTQQGLGGGYADALGSGLWPSQDVLTPGLRRQQGVALAPFERVI